MDKTCLDCGEILRGRADKKFCDDQCRSNYNNKLKADDYKEVKKVNHILLKNRKILAELTPDGKAKVTKAKLLKSEFNFNYHTHYYTTTKGATYIFCYEYGYLALEQDWFLLVHNQEDK
jgi:hypothetical protein